MKQFSKFAQGAMQQLAGDLRREQFYSFAGGGENTTSGERVGGAVPAKTTNNATG